MHIEIKSRFSDKIIFEGEYSSIKDAVEDAIKNKVSLQYADLRGADLQYADLRGAYLQGADLRGEILIIFPVQVLGLRWFVLITPQYMSIGCERHTHEEWANFNRVEISKMDTNAWDWWTVHKDVLLNMCSIHKLEAEKELQKCKQ